MTIVPDFDRTVALPVRNEGARMSRPASGVGGSSVYWLMRSLADVVGALILLPIVGFLAIVLLLLNPVLNPGPLFYRQRRMGRGCRSFVALKFRTMTCDARKRGAYDPVEVDRITPLGGLLRRMGLDELPQATNVLRREMSLIGPRPDCVDHADEFLKNIPEYKQRFCVRPGMSGLSQIQLGYAVGTEATRRKALSDIDYIARAGVRLDLWIVWRTLVTMVNGRGD